MAKDAHNEIYDTFVIFPMTFTIGRRTYTIRLRRITLIWLMSIMMLSVTEHSLDNDQGFSGTIGICILFGAGWAIWRFMKHFLKDDFPKFGKSRRRDRTNHETTTTGLSEISKFALIEENWHEEADEVVYKFPSE
jgi:hypothetical protein